MSLKAKVAGFAVAAGLAVAGLAPVAQAADPVGNAVDNATTQITTRVDNAVDSAIESAEQAFPGLDLDLRP